jgi:hypothetical protein
VYLANNHDVGQATERGERSSQSTTHHSLCSNSVGAGGAKIELVQRRT